MNMKPAHPDTMRELKNQIKNDIQKVKSKIVKKAQKLMTKAPVKCEEEGDLEVVACV